MNKQTTPKGTVYWRIPTHIAGYNYANNENSVARDAILAELEAHKFKDEIVVMTDLFTREQQDIWDYLKFCPGVKKLYVEYSRLPHLLSAYDNFMAPLAMPAVAVAAAPLRRSNSDEFSVSPGDFNLPDMWRA